MTCQCGDCFICEQKRDILKTLAILLSKSIIRAMRRSYYQNKADLLIYMCLTSPTEHIIRETFDEFLLSWKISENGEEPMDEWDWNHYCEPIVENLQNVLYYNSPLFNKLYEIRGDDIRAYSEINISYFQ